MLKWTARMGNVTTIHGFHLLDILFENGLELISKRSVKAICFGVLF